MTPVQMNFKLWIIPINSGNEMAMTDLENVRSLLLLLLAIPPTVVKLWRLNGVEEFCLNQGDLTCQLKRFDEKD